MKENCEKNEGVSTKVLAKSGIWYTVCNFLFKAVIFLATPFFARIMSVEEMGEFMNFSSWVIILEGITSLSMYQSIILLKVENDDDMDSFVLSILVLTSVTTVVVFGLILLFPSFFTSFFGFDLKYIYVMFAYLFFSSAYQMYITKERAYYKYKKFVLLSGIAIISSALLPMALLFLMENKLTARLVGYYFPYIMIGVGAYIYFLIKGKRVKLKYWKSALTLCLPLVPHVLSLNLLSGSDKIIITRLSGSELTAIYGMACLVLNILNTLFDSMNKAWSPWLIENLHAGKYEEIKKFSRIYIALFLIPVIGGMLIAPEVLYILGGKGYDGSEYCLPPLFLSGLFTFIYTMYVNIEFSKKKTGMVSVATIGVTLLNIALNLVFIPMSVQNGHIIAAYTTLIGYIALFVVHFLLVKRMKMDFVYDTKYIILILIGVSIISLFITWLYAVTWLRYTLILAMIGLVVFLLVRYRELIKSKLRTMK